MSVQQPEALRLAARLDPISSSRTTLLDLHREAAEELRRLHTLNQDLLDSLNRLSFAAMCRDNSSGDPCRLIEVKAELQAANKQASDLISKQQEI